MREFSKLAVGAVAALGLITTPAMAQTTRAATSPGAKSGVSAPVAGVRVASRVTKGSNIAPVGWVLILVGFTAAGVGIYELVKTDTASNN